MSAKRFAWTGFCAGVIALSLGACSEGFLPFLVPQTVVQRVPVGVKGHAVLLLQMTFQDLPNLMLQSMSATSDQSDNPPTPEVKAVWLDLSTLQATPVALGADAQDPLGIGALFGADHQELSDARWTVTAAWEGGPVQVVNNVSGASADYLGDSRGADYAPLLGLASDRLIASLPNERVAVIELDTGTSSVIDGVPLDTSLCAFSGQFLAYRERQPAASADTSSGNPPSGDAAEPQPTMTGPPPLEPIVLLDVTTGARRTIATEIGYISPVGLPQVGGSGAVPGFLFANGQLIWREDTESGFIVRQYTLATDTLVTLLDMPGQEGDATSVTPLGLNESGVLLERDTTPFGADGPPSLPDMLSMQATFAIVFQPFEGPTVPILDFTLNASDFFSGAMGSIAALVDDFVLAYDPRQGDFVVYQISTGQTQRTNPFGA